MERHNLKIIETRNGKVLYSCYILIIMELFRNDSCTKRQIIYNKQVIVFSFNFVYSSRLSLCGCLFVFFLDQAQC